MKVYIVLKETESGNEVHAFLDIELGQGKWQKLLDNEKHLVVSDSVVGHLAFASKGIESIGFCALDL